MAATVEPAYLGDGVYASFDGYQILISVNDHRNPPAVALEPEVIESLIRYRDKCFGTDKTKA